MQKLISRTFLFLTIFFVSFLLSSCGGNEDAGTAVTYLEAMNEGDVATATELVCPARADDVTMGLISVNDASEPEFSFNNISCSETGSGVECRFVVEAVTMGDEGEFFQQNRSVIFEFEDGKICGFEEQVAQ